MLGLLPWQFATRGYDHHKPLPVEMLKPEKGIAQQPKAGILDKEAWALAAQTRAKRQL
ncbi:hypothetical protein ACFO5Q_17595 [Kordiimonas lipolytica]|uniref:Uncharacterized protein n=1 Tax=Kordiimonas lipolytica TaxID=1662421 RepID=A0ABV8UGS1_9PROT|nr:hypothetical protein [Kordiimonas lipolytica]